MGTYNSAVITNGGQSMIAQAVAGASLEFTTIKTSNYAYPAGTNLATLTTINGIKQSKDITSATVYNSRVIKISAAVDNTGISTAYTINAIGIYAKVGSSAESLFAVVTASAADTMPAYSNKPYSYIYEINLTMQNAANMTVTVNAAGLVNVADLNAAKFEIQGEIADLRSALEEDRTLNSIKKESIGVTTGVGTGPVANTRRWFLPDVIPAGAIIKDTNYFCASATSGTVDIELWEKTGDALSRVLVVTQTPTASTWNNASLNYNADKEVMISFKPSSGSIRSDSLATGKVTFAAEDLTSETLSYSALAPFQNLQICANVNYLMKSDNIFVVDADGNGDYTSFSQALITVFANYPNATIIVNPGTYDIYQEMMDIYGSDYWDSITTSQADQKRNLFGLPFGNGMKIHGNSGAIIVMDNISSNNTVKTWFSVLHGEDDPNSKYQGAEVKNLVINCRNIRYAVHIDFGSELNSGEYLIESCKMSLDNSQNDQRTNAYVLGMGGGAYTTYKFINNYLTPVFPPNTRDHAGVYFHNSGNANAKNRCNIEFNYIGNAGTIRVDAYGTSQNKCLAMITGNSIGEEVMVFNIDDNLEVIEWNNSVRT